MHPKKANYLYVVNLRRIWKAGEDFVEYYNSKLQLSVDIQVEKEEMIDYLIEGIPNESLRTQAYMQRFTTKEQVKEAFSKVVLKETGNSGQQQLQQKKEHLKVRCFNCNSVGHIATECRKPKRAYGACYACGSLDHRAADCKERKKAVVVVEENEYVRVFNYNFDNKFKTNLFCPLDTLLDTGSPISFIKKSSLPNAVMNNTNFAKSCNSNFIGLNKTILKSYGKIACTIVFLNANVEMLLMVVADEAMSFDVVLGRDFLRKTNSKLMFNFKDNTLSEISNCNSSKSVNDCNYKFLPSNVKNDCDDERTSNNSDSKENSPNIDKIQQGVVIDDERVIVSGCETEDRCWYFSDLNTVMPRSDYNEDIDVVVGNDVTFHERKRLIGLLSKRYIKVDKPTIPEILCEVKLSLNCTKPFNCSPRRVSYAEKLELQKLLDDYLKNNYIRPSNSEYASPIVLVKKKTGDLRMCIDFRKLNKVTAKDNYPIPLIYDLLEKMAKKKLFTKLDLKNGFFHVFMRNDSTKYTSFVTPLGQYEFLRMPFGLKNAPSTFQRFVNNVFADMIRDGKVVIYIDDIMIATKNFEEHMNIIAEVLDRLVKNKLELRLDKCEFLQTNVKFLGYMVRGDGIKADEKGLQAVKKFPSPTSIHSVQSFLGLCSYFRRFVKDFSTLAKPLYDLTKKDMKFNFGQTELACFELLKSKLLEAPVLALYEPNDETELHCDASALGFGAILLQKKDDDKFHPIFYFSKRTSEIESKYHSFELETLAIIYALKRFRIYLQGKNFKIVTDCNSLTLALNKKEINPRIARWALELQNYDYTLEHRDNKRMQHVDALSRNTNILVIETNTFEENLIVCQGQDKKLEKLREELQKTEHSLYEMRNGIIYRKKTEGNVAFYVPENRNHTLCSNITTN